MSISILRRNIAKLKEINPKLGFALTMVDPEELRIGHTQKNEPNLYRIYQEKTYFYHSEMDAEKEANDWFHSIPLTNVSILYIYGIGLGYFYDAAKEWLKEDKKRALIFLESDPSVLYRLFETERGSRLLKDPQVKIHYLEDDAAFFNELTWTYISCPFIFTCLPLYKIADAERCKTLEHRLTHESAQKISFVDEYLHYGVSFYRNFYPNLFLLPESYLGNALFGKFSNIPAIVCGAGPSLNKNFQELTKLKNKALIFAGSSSLNAIIPRDLIPHFGVGIDPNNAQKSRIEAVNHLQIPFFYRSRLFHDALKAIKGPKLYLGGSSGYDIAAWCDKALNIEEAEELDEGHNVVNFSIEIAKALGCNPIILVGVDLALTNDKFYSEGVLENLKINQKELETHIGKDFESTPIIKTDIFGKPVKTFWKWVSEAKWISDFAKENPEIQIINATEGGIGFEGIQNETLKNVSERYLKESFPLEDKIKKEILNSPLSKQVSKEKIVELLQQLENSLANSVELLETLLKEMQEMHREIKKGKIFSDLQTPTIALTEAKLDKEPAFEAILDIFNIIYLNINKRKIRDIQLPSRKTSPKTQQLNKIKLNIDRLDFVHKIAKFHLKLIKLYLTN